MKSFAFGFALACASAQASPSKGLYGIQVDQNPDLVMSLNLYSPDGTTKTIVKNVPLELIAQELSCIDQASGVYYFMAQNEVNQTTDLVGYDLSTGQQSSRVALPFAEVEYAGTGQMMASGLVNGDIIVGGQLSAEGGYVVGTFNPVSGNFTKIATLPARSGSFPNALPSAYSPKSNIFAAQVGEGSAATWYYVNMGTGKYGSWPDCGAMQTIDYDAARDAFIGVGLTGDANRTVVLMNATTGECTTLGQIDGYFLLQSGEAAFDGSSGTLWTLLSPASAPNSVHLLGVNTASTPVTIAQDHALTQDSPWQLEYYYGE